MSQKQFNRKDRPSFCFITPTAYLEDFAVMSNHHLVLAHIVDKNPVYASFYKTQSDLGAFVILDNSAFELSTPYDPEKLIELGKRCGADAIVLPDYPWQAASKTIQAAQKWMEEIKRAGFSTMFVPQSMVGDVEDWISAYMWAADHPDIDIIGMSILAIPNAMPHIPAAYARVVMTEILIDRGVFSNQKFHHYLGLNAGPALELPALILQGALNSCDSSGPVWSGILGHEYSRNTDSYLSVSKVKAHVDFDYPRTKDQETINRIRRNVDLTLELFDI